MIDADVMQDRIRDANPIPNVENLDTDELAYFVAATRARRAAAVHAPTQHPSETATPPAAPPPRRRGVWAFAAAFVLILVVVGATALLLSDGGEPPADEPTPPTTLETPAEPISVESLTWSRVELDEVVFNPRYDSLSSVTAGGPGFVAVGQTNAPNSVELNGDAGVWTSGDGITWSLIPHDEPPLGGLGYQTMESVTAGGPGLVAVGGVLDEPGRGGLFAAVWTSGDGTAWSRIPHDPEAFGSPDAAWSWMGKVTVGGPGLVAVGRHDRNAAVWTSPDGITWTRVPHDADVFGSGRMHDVVNAGTRLVAIGELKGQSAVWMSPDGINWSVFPVFPSDLDIDAVAAGGPGLVAVGDYESDPPGCLPHFSGPCYARVWTSVDGITWTPVPHNSAVFGGSKDPQGMHAVATVGSDLVAVGSSVWTSPDGITWKRVFHDPAVIAADWGMKSVAVADRGLIAVGDGDDAAIWRATPKD
jgi:hypothetical protein